MEDRLRKYAALIDAGSFTGAARELHLSQPALSTSIAKLERELKAELYIRGSRPLTPTAAGQLAYGAAKRLDHTLDALQMRLAAIAQADVTVSLGLIDSIASTLLADDRMLVRIEQQHKVSIAVNNTRKLLESIERGELDMALIAERPTTLPAIAALQHVGTEPLVLVCHAGQSAALRAALHNRQLPRFISYDQPSTTSRLVHEALHRHGIVPQPVLYSTSPEVMLRLVLLQQGVAALPYFMVRGHVASGELAILGLGDPAPWIIGRGIASAHRRDKTVPAPLTAVAKQLAQQLAALTLEAEQVASQQPRS